VKPTGDSISGNYAAVNSKEYQTQRTIGESYESERKGRIVFGKLLPKWNGIQQTEGRVQEAAGRVASSSECAFHIASVASRIYGI